MTPVTIVYTTVDAHAETETIDMENLGPIVACCIGDAMEERDEALLWHKAYKEAEKVAHLYTSPAGVLMFLKAEQQRLLLDYRDKKKEPSGS